MTNERSCPTCGAVLPADAPDDLCPRCLLQRGLADPAGGAPPDFVVTGAGGRAAHAVAVEELQRCLPDLELEGVLGEGGMGVVYRARQVKLDRTVAVKVLPGAIGADPAFAERFAREARAMARLNHPNIVSVYDFGEANGLYYLVMEYVEGANLRHLLRAGKLPPEQALAIVPQVCDALQYAHREGVVHRDIKPENILLDLDGKVKIADFGLAKLSGPTVPGATLTGTGQVMGTMHYMAPEQLERPLEVDHRADIFSLGVVFYEALTGGVPMGRFSPPSKKAPMDARLDGVVLKALEEDPADRYQNASEVRTEVERLGETPAPSPAREPLVAARASAQAGRSAAAPRVSRMAVGSLVLSAIGAPALLMGLWIFTWNLGLGAPDMSDLEAGDVHMPAPDQFAKSISTLFATATLLFFWSLLFNLSGTISGFVALSRIRSGWPGLRGAGMATVGAWLAPLLVANVAVLLPVLLSAELIGGTSPVHWTMLAAIVLLVVDIKFLQFAHGRFLAKVRGESPADLERDTGGAGAEVERPGGDSASSGDRVVAAPASASRGEGVAAPRLSRLALASMLLTLGTLFLMLITEGRFNPVGILFGDLYNTLNSSNSGTGILEQRQPVLSILYPSDTIASLFYVFSGTICGFVALSRIRSQWPALRGVGMATVGAWSFPLLFLNGLLLAPLFNTAQQMRIDGGVILAPGVIPAAIVLLLAFDVVLMLVYRAWFKRRLERS